MSKTYAIYRACYYFNSDAASREVVLTSRDEADLPDDDLIAAAVREAYRADIVSKDGDESRLSEDALRANLHIGDWTEQ